MTKLKKKKSKTNKQTPEDKTMCLLPFIIDTVWYSLRNK